MLLFRFNIRIPLVYYEKVIELWWQSRRSMTKPMAKLWDCVWVSGCWALWRERNRRLFAAKNKTIPDLVGMSQAEITNWHRSL